MGNKNNRWSIDMNTKLTLITQITKWLKNNKHLYPYFRVVTAYDEYQPITPTQIRFLTHDFEPYYKWYIKELYDCDDFSHACLGHIREKEPKAAVFEVWLTIHNRFTHSMLMFWDGSKCRLFEPQTRGFRDFYDEKVFFIFG